MMRHHSSDFHRRDVEYEDEYEDEYENEYEEEGSEPDEEDEPEAPTKEELDFLKLREQLKERAKKNLKKQLARDLGHSSHSQDKNRLIKRETFGSFFGPSKPVIASRVLEESRSIRETKHIVANVYANKKEPAPSSEKTNGQHQKSGQHQRSVHIQRPKVNEVKKKAQTLKDMRDYSFLLSDDADFPTPVKEQPVKRSVPTPAKEQPVKRSVPTPAHDRRLAQAPLKNNGSASKPPRTISSGTELKNSSSSVKALENKSRMVKDAPTNRTSVASNQPRKVPGSSAGNGSAKSAANATLSKVPAQVVHAKKPLNVAKGSNSKKFISSAMPKSSIPPQYSEHKRPNQAPVQTRPTPKQPLPSRPQPSKQNPLRAPPDERLKKRPPQRNHSDEEVDYHEKRPKKRPHPGNYDDEEVDYRSLIRGMFGYNPNKYAGMDEDDSDMEVGFDRIQKEERRSSKIAREEDEIELRRIEEEEERERQRKKMKKRLK